MGTAYTENFDVIVNKNPRYPHFFVHHNIHSKIKLIALKFGNYNIMSTLQSLNTWLNLNRFSTHREASIVFIKYISTGLTLHHIAKKKVSTILTNVDISPEDIITLQETTEGDAIHHHNSTRKPDGQLKNPTKKTVSSSLHSTCPRNVYHGSIRSQMSPHSFYYS